MYQAQWLKIAIKGSKAGTVTTLRGPSRARQILLITNNWLSTIDINIIRENHGVYILT